MIALTTAFLASMFVSLLLVKYQHVHVHLTADYDLKSVQKFHAAIVPRIGGLAIFFGLMCGEAAKLLFEPEVAKFGFFLIFSAVPSFVIGFVEDLTKRVGIIRRFLGMLLSAIIGGIVLEAWLIRLDIQGVDYLMSFTVFSVSITCFAVTGVTNAFNLIDGYNGLAGMVAVIILCGLAYVGEQVGDRSVVIAAYTTAGAILGFLIWNYPMGLIFLGDGGAYLIGFLIAELAILLVVRNPKISPWFPLLLVYYPIFETIFTIFRRIFIGKKHPGLPDAAHLHQLIYRRVVRWAVGESCVRKKIQRNSLTSPYLWAMASITVIPATIFWENKILLQITTLFFTGFYIYIYRKIYTARFPKWLAIKNKKVR